MRAFIVLGLTCLLVTFAACTKKPATTDEESTDGVGGGNVTVGTAAVFVNYSADTHTDLSVKVTGVVSGETVTLYSDAGCTTSITSETASGSSVSFQLSGLSAGTHTYYAKSGTGPCSAVPASYRVTSCPTGYVKVEGDATLGIKPFCIMQFEAKKVAGKPVSEALGTPWMGDGSITVVGAKTACQSLNTGGTTGYDLISSLEWSTVANEIERNTADNYFFDSGSYTYYRGNSNNDAGPSAVTDINDPLNGVTHNGAPTTYGLYNRTMKLRNGSVIWDLVGNTFEAIDYGQGATILSPPPCTANSGNPIVIRNAGNCPNTPPQHYMSLDESGTNTGFGNTTVISASDSTIMRGGGHSNTSSGFNLWSMTGVTTSTALSATTGFRCVYRLNPPTRIASPALTLDLVNTSPIPFTGAQPGEVITLSTNQMCSNSVGSAQATTTTPTVTATVPSAGTFNIYFKTTNLAGVTSPCQPLKTTYTYVTCPTGMVSVPGNATRGVSAFCVQKFEARNNGSFGISGDPANAYLTGYTAANYKTKCEASVTGRDLISNQEWLTIADNIYNVASNWSGGAVESGTLPRGVSGSAAAATVGDPGSDYWYGVLVGGNPTTEFQYRRMLKLSNGNEIWDFAGNNYEMVDFGTTPSTYTGIPACLTGDGDTGEEFSNAGTSCPAISAANLQPQPSENFRGWDRTVLSALKWWIF